MGGQAGNVFRARLAGYPVQRRGGTPGDPSRLKTKHGPAGATPENDPARITRRR